MTWRDEIQQASFRNVSFEYETADSTFGRRVEVFEYPQKDIPNAEDLGRKARERSFSAFVIGDDYIAKRDALLGALEKAGPGELVHPYFGRMMVSVTNVSLSESIRDGGMCTFQISFVESGETVYPSANNATNIQSLQAVDALETTCIANFTEDFNIAGLPEFAVHDAVNNLNVAFDTINKALVGISVVLSDPLSLLQADVSALVRSPADLASRFFGIFAKGAAVIDQVSGLGDINSLNLLNAFTTLRLVNLFPNTTSVGNTPTRSRIIQNQIAVNSLVRQALIAQTAGMVATMPLPVYDDTLVIKNELLSTIDNELQTANDSAYLALKNVRTKTHADVTARAQMSARLKSITPIEVTPALVLAYELYENTERDSEIIIRNQIRHPGFIPANTIKVLSA